MFATVDDMLRAMPSLTSEASSFTSRPTTAKNAAFAGMPRPHTRWGAARRTWLAALTARAAACGTAVAVAVAVAASLCACGAANTATSPEAPANAEAANSAGERAAVGPASGAANTQGGAPAAASASASAPGAAASANANSAGAAASPSDKPTEPEGGDANTAPRNVKYFASPDSLRVEVEGVSFIPKAELVKKGKTWTLRVRVETRAKAGVSRTLLTPQGADIAIAGSIQRTGSGSTEKFVDHRNGDRETVVQGDKPIALSRVWPAANGPKPLNEGDEVDLMVGLWGFGPDSGSMRPLTKLCRFHGKIDHTKQRLIAEPPPGMGQ